MTDLQKLKAGLAEKLDAKQKAEFSVEAIEGQFAEELSKWLELNPEVKTLHEQLEKAKEEKKAADTAWKDSRKEAATELVDYFDEKPEDKDIVDAFSFRREKKPSWWGCLSDDDKVVALTKAGATFLLQVDEKAVTAFVKNMAVENKDAFMMPHGISTWLPELSVEIEIKATISDKNLLK